MWRTPSTLQQFQTIFFQEESSGDKQQPKVRQIREPDRDVDDVTWVVTKLQYPLDCLVRLRFYVHRSGHFLIFSPGRLQAVFGRKNLQYFTMSMSLEPLSGG
ncbi:hypothetical protein RRG08_029409 [Elysia crispata]|uniref:Uncharacterized protein n=1 Tax=Elysia crispata TaxID=231223 RepID=A0AAE1D8K2_9GAST|nr:hypothetical protein RRG08_029409 [Elysia crispata]